MIKFGDVEEVRGEIVRGTIPLVDHPTGGSTPLHVIIASGSSDGPTFLITGNVHGNESIGIVIIHRLVEMLDLDSLRGRLICIPSLNPTGTLIHTRQPMFDPRTDPNRVWPSANPKKHELVDETDWLDKFMQAEDQPGPQERAWIKIHEIIKEASPDFHIDLHTCSTLSIPYSFLDRVLYEDNLEEAKDLHQRTREMVEATGLTIIGDASAARYYKYGLYRSTSGTSLNKLRIPATTFELGPKNDIVPEILSAAIKALRNIMRWAIMIDGDYEEINEVLVKKRDELYREVNYPIAPVTGIYDYLKAPGEDVNIGDTIAVVRDISGVRIHEIVSELDGYIMAWWPGITHYEGVPLGLFAAPDRLPFVVKWDEIPK